MIRMLAARILCTLAVLAPVVLALQPTRANATAGFAAGPREGSKTALIIDLMKRPGGATLKEVMEAASWQAHSVRGFVSGTLTKKMSLTVVSAKRADGERTYSIPA